MYCLELLSVVRFSVLKDSLLLHSATKLFQVYDINTVTILGTAYNSSKDHSKWGVSLNKKVPTVCIGDVNRQVSQFKRGGGAVCIEDSKLWKIFHGSIGAYDNCRGVSTQCE
ncbi:unnamed protein product [Strongylus vulgaris]|uniref:Uncharacterized protein n=1 Tax=Strongylus vulgaris TaxID=40348 RepID=A0A3P7JDR1_STRVU|nr:unnamed protein product [Strongylus vulgaris]